MWIRILVTAAGLSCSAAIIDRIAIVVGKRAILASAIDRDIRVTSFLNHETPDFSAASRKAAASRLIDQELIREQIRTGDYPVAPESEAMQLLAQIKKERFATDAQYRQALRHAAISEAELKDRLSWQLTVLRFIDARFRPEAVVTEEEIRRQEMAHPAERQTVIDQLMGEHVNTLLDDWLKQARKQTRIECLDKSLQ